MSRVDLTHILAPAALQPRTSGPRDTGTDLPRVDVLAARLEPRGVITHVCADDDDPPTTKEQPMTATRAKLGKSGSDLVAAIAKLGKNGSDVVAAITKHGPMDTPALRVWLGDAPNKDS